MNLKYKLNKIKNQINKIRGNPLPTYEKDNLNLLEKDKEYEVYFIESDVISKLIYQCSNTIYYVSGCELYYEFTGDITKQVKQVELLGKEDYGKTWIIIGGI